MIKRSLSLLLLMFSMSIFGQEEVHSERDTSMFLNRFLIGGSIQLNGEVALESYVYYGNITINSGYFLTNNIMLGMEGKATLAPTSRYFETVPIARWYQPLSGHHVIYAGGRGGYGWGQDISIFDGSSKGRYAWVWGGRFGYLSMLSDNVALDVFALYNERYSAVQRPDGYFSNLSTTASFGFGFGLQVFL